MPVSSRSCDSRLHLKGSAPDLLLLAAMALFLIAALQSWTGQASQIAKSQNQAAISREPEDRVLINTFFQNHCIECHGNETSEAGLNLESLAPANSDNFTTWVTLFDRVERGEMPPRDQPVPSAEDSRSVLRILKQELNQAEADSFSESPSTGLRRLTRVEYENTMRDLFDLPGISLQALLPPDGSAHGFDRNSTALSISHVNMAKYIEAADRTLDLAIATRPAAPRIQKLRTSLLSHGGQAPYLSMQGDVVLLRDKQPDPAYPPASEHPHIDQGAHELMGSFDTDSSVGILRREDESVNYYFRGHTTIYPGRYRVRASVWSFQWDQGKVMPSRGTEALRLAAVQLTSDGRGGQHPNDTLDYLAAPSLSSLEHEREIWLNENEILGCDVASLAPAANYHRAGRAMSFTGPGIAVDWLEVEGPLHPIWPPQSHRILFGELPIEKWDSELSSNSRPPRRVGWERLWLGLGKNERDPVDGVWMVQSQTPLVDADRLLGTFLPKAFRRPVSPSTRERYVALVGQRLEAGDCFESAMRFAVRTALCSPDFLYHVEHAASGDNHRIDDHALANRLAYFLWGSIPDDRLRRLADQNEFGTTEVLKQEAERMLADPRSERFVEDFLGQWLKLRAIAANDPDKKLYPEFSPYLQESMVAETHAYFRELLDRDLDATHLVASNFAMLNEKLATHYDIPEVSGPEIRRVELPADCPRGGLLTQGSILKVTANGTTTSPVPRGAFVLDRILGRPPGAPPASVPAVEPDVRGATTIRELLAKHRSDPTCSSCHAKFDPPGFALESFDVIGGFRTRYRSLEQGDPAERGSIDPFIDISFKLGPAVDSSGELLDGRRFDGIRELQRLLAEDQEALSRNLVKQWLVYATGRPPAFRDREAIDSVLSMTEAQNGGVRTLLLQVIQSSLFSTR